VTTVAEQIRPMASADDAPPDADRWADGTSDTRTVAVSPAEEPPRSGAARPIVLVGVAIVALVVAAGAALYAIGPLLHQRDQRSLMATERQDLASAAHDNEGLYREAAPTTPPAPGSPLGILTVPAIGLQQVVVEGVGPSQTAAAPGHVPGTAGMGQPGNAAVVGRRSAYGGSFGRLTDLRSGDRMVVSTTQGESLYVVHSVRSVTLATPPATPASAVTTTTLGRQKAAKSTTTAGSGSRSAATSAGGSAGGGTGAETMTDLYGPSSGDQLTLVTSASSVPWNTNQAIVVVAHLKGQPFAPTLQQSRSLNQQGNSGDPNALAWLLLALLAMIAALIGAVALYRRTTARAAYLLTTAPLLALAVLVAVAASHLLPAWS
jgi:sortase A